MESRFPRRPGQPQDRLTADERRLIGRLLSDPTYFPIEFRSWLKNFLSNELFQAQLSQDGAGGAPQKTGLPAGIIIPLGSMTIPTDCLGCDGAVYSRTEYPDLFSVIGTNWGAGDGSTTFNIPDFRDRALWCVGGRVGLGQTDGAPLGSRGGPSHHHRFVGTLGGGAHSHSGQTSTVGDHQHQPVFANFARMNYSTFPEGAQPTLRFAVTEGDPFTGPAGAHSHSFETQGGAQDGDHGHPVDAATTGGFKQDEPSWAGVAYAITTGKA